MKFSKQSKSGGVRRAAGRALRGACLALLAAHCLAAAALAQYGRPPASEMPVGGTPEVLKAVGIDQKLGAQVPLNLTFRDESGREVRLADYFAKGRPVVLSLVYYECPMLCNQILNGLVGTLEAVSFTPGQEFEVVTVSFDPRETPELAAAKKETYIRRYRRTGAEGGWHFLTGDKEAIDRLAEAVGFGYVWDERSEQFAHASAIMVATPDGRLSHYFYGIEYPPKELRLALVEASGGHVGSPVDQLILYCYHYDPTAGRYGPAIMNIMRAAGVATVFGVVALVLALRRRRDGESWGRGPGAGGS
ncbi:MAG TPA: SCO family protein [Pyrinomonadaceae bacterium]|nr:SCO family protein [Pyrinomonadaceae bacterium]